MAEATPSGSGWGVNDDFFTFDVPNGLAVVAIGFTTDRRTWAWIGSENFKLEYGFVTNPPNGDLMPQWGLSSLLPNRYGMYVSDNDLQSHPTVASYQLNFVVQPIPEPTSTALIVVSGMAAMALNCRVIFRSR